MFKSRRVPPWAGPLLLVAALLLVGGAALFSLPGDGGVRFTNVAQVELPLPAASPNEQSHASEAAPAGPPPPDPALLAQGPFGPLPQIAPDGRRPFFVYARAFDFALARPHIAVLVLGLGLDARLTEQALSLPGTVSLSFSPYAPDLEKWFARARETGHEVILGLPVADDPAADAGPRALVATASLEENRERLEWVLARAPGYIALATRSDGFARSEPARLVLDVLAGRGLALVEIASRGLRDLAHRVGLPYARAELLIEEAPSALAVDYALASLETEALEKGNALGAVRAYPVVLERLRAWAAALADKGLALAPVSALVIERSGLTSETPFGTSSQG